MFAIPLLTDDLTNLAITASAEDVFLVADDADTISLAFSFLSETEQRVLELRLGLDGVEMSVARTGSLLRMPKAAVEQIYEEALLKLRAALAGSGVDRATGFEVAA